VPHAERQEDVLRVGAVPYLNARPLVFGLESAADGLEVVYDAPRRLAEMLGEGTLDLGLVPSIAYTRPGAGSIVPGIAIASHGEALSALLVARKPLKDIRCLALDANSLATITLAQVLCLEKYRIRPRLMERVPGIAALEQGADAVVLIGDPAMALDVSRFPCVLDLGKEWTDMTGLPFVYALWLARIPESGRAAAAALWAAKARGIEHIGEVASDGARRLGLPRNLCLRYLTRHIRYDLGPAELAGLREFYKLCAKHDLSDSVALRFCA
jgi:chorismate dehydratase